MSSLRKGHFNNKLMYEPTKRKRKKKAIQRNVISFSSSDPKNVCCDLSNKFLDVLNVHFLIELTDHTIYNEDTIKLP